MHCISYPSLFHVTFAFEKLATSPISDRNSYWVEATTEQKGTRGPLCVNNDWFIDTPGLLLNLNRVCEIVHYSKYLHYSTYVPLRDFVGDGEEECKGTNWERAKGDLWGNAMWMTCDLYG